ncbi:MAG: UDP-N-acetylglucosamine 1-carboxyvinyltransferase [bacterium]|nr:UDP-N-acetylglucosamine 1-carboxyvinyltransferase [bacterium]
MSIDEKFRVEGGHPLSGTVPVSGNKNEALPVLSACLLTTAPMTLRNMPLIGDVLVMGDLLRKAGVQVETDAHDTHVWHITAGTLDAGDVDAELFRKIRASITLAAPLLHRCGKVTLPIPGGDKIGKRRLDTHLLALQEMGVEIFEEEHAYLLRCRDGLRGADLWLDEASVTGTENIIMAAVCARGTTSIYNAACEPHVQQLCHCLNAMGARIEGIGTNRLLIHGVAELGGTAHTIAPDFIEIGSFIGLAAATGSTLTIAAAAQAPIRIILKAFARLGIETQVDGAHLVVPATQARRIVTDFRGAIPKIESAIWPGVPADLISILLVAATQCHGTVLIHEKLYESRLFFVDRLVGMGARIVLCDPHRALVVGHAPLHGDYLTSPDIRAGVALLIAALCAKGTSVIDNIQMIDRGYENIDGRLRALGARITRITD